MNQIESKFREQSSSLEVIPSPQAWTKLSRKLDKTHLKNRSPWQWAIAAGFLLLVGSLAFYLSSDLSSEPLPYSLATVSTFPMDPPTDDSYLDQIQVLQAAYKKMGIK
jgi:hypothetical protein